MKERQGDQPPNVLLIMDDQHRFDYLGCAGAEFIRTPNLDRLASMGVRFEQCTTNSPVCVPARIGLASGIAPHRIGSIGNNSQLPSGIRTMHHQFRDAGYRVGCVGKLDLRTNDRYNGRHGDRPCVYSWGFTHPEECEGKMHAGSSPVPIGPYTNYLAEKGQLTPFYEDYRKRAKAGYIKGVSHDSVLTSEDFEDCYIGTRATKWIEEVPDDFPWQLFVSFVGPHHPFDPPKEFADRYRHADMPEPIPSQAENRPAWYANRQIGLSSQEIKETRQQYCAAIELIDEQIGKMFYALESRGMMENTIIAFTSDHGEMLGDQGMYNKWVPYEASVRIPLMIAGPGVPAEQTSDALVELMDLNPTLCEMARVPVADGVEAKSLLPVLRGERTDHREDALIVIRGYASIRSKTHKLIRSEDGFIELYDLISDPHEQNNVAQDHPGLVQDLVIRLDHRIG